MSAEHTAEARTTPTTRVVLGFDGSTSARTALEAAVAHARWHRAPLLLLCAVEVSDAVSTQAFSAVAEDMLAATAAIVRNGPDAPEVRTALRFGSATAALLEVERPGDLLVVGTHGHRPVARVLLGSTSTSVVTHAHEPVLVVRSGPVAGESPVVVGVDGSTSSVAAVLAAAAEADHAGVPLRAVVAVPPVVDPMGFTSGPDAQEIQEAQAFLSEAVAGLHERYPDLVIERVVSQTHPVLALVRAARQGRLLVLGSRGRGTFRSLLLGSVSRETVQRAATSVLVVRPTGAVPPPPVLRTPALVR